MVTCGIRRIMAITWQQIALNLGSVARSMIMLRILK